jgi:hypothetical protein
MFLDTLICGIVFLKIRELTHIRKSFRPKDKKGNFIWPVNLNFPGICYNMTYHLGKQTRH